jgi:HAD superfamily hydrolase (TIGR01490 family)
MSLSSGKPIAFFDVDKTLMDGYVAYYAVMEMIRRGIIQKRHILKAVVYRMVGHIFKTMNVRHMYELALEDLAGRRVEDMMALGLEIFQKEIQPHLFLEGMEEIQKRKKAGQQVVLLSSGPFMIVKNMEAFMGADDSFSVRPNVKSGVILKTIQEPLAYEEGKVIIANRFAEKNNVHLKDCYFYSDGASDLPLLMMVGHPRAVNPDPYLKREAEKRGWPILEFKKTLNKTLAISS